MTESQKPAGGRGLTPTDFFQIEAIFDEVVDLDPEGRRAALDERCFARPDLRAHVDSLLESHERLAGFLQPVGRAEHDEAAEAELWSDVAVAPRLGTGSRVGPYRLLEKIGEGGMGEVYLAERVEGEFLQRVAVKVTGAAVRDTESARRFRAERQILASLQHPHIVTLLDGGASEGGEAYLVMEHVDGVPLTHYCADRGLPLEQRIQLLRQICLAVQYAHQRGIVHRDLKPANILVTRDGVPKVVDFGVAKLLESSSLAGATVTGMFPGPLTPNYASPEQLRGLAVTTASDVYALGVLAYEVIAGVRPYDTAGKTLDQVLDIVLKTEPARPSSATGATGGDRAAPAYSRARLKGDLDAIVLKAMRKAPDARYSSAGELADDLERFTTGQPVVAREPSLAYVLRRLAMRHRTAVFVGAASIFVIVAALGVALWQRQVAIGQEARAQQRFREVRQLANALIFKIHNAVAALPGSTPVRQTIVTEALAYLERLEAESQGDETLQLELGAAYVQIGAILGDPGNANLGDRAGALRQYERARALVLPIASRPDPPPMSIVGLVNVNRFMAQLLSAQGQYDRAKEMAQQAVDAAERLHSGPARHALAGDLRSRAAFTLAFVIQKREESIPYWQRALELAEAELAAQPDDGNRMRNVALVEKYLGGRLDGMGRDAEAETHYRRALDLDEKRYAADPGNRVVQFDVAIDFSNVAGILEGQNRIDEAYAMFKRSLELRQQLSSADPKDELARGRLAYVRMRMARIELKRGNRAGALEHATEAIAHHQTVVARTNGLENRRELGAALVTLSDIVSDRRAESCAAIRRANRLFEAAGPTAYEFYAKRAADGAASCAAR
jgi:non-specific serine/threonine protein kinase/serine/threonine-protein kinase